MSSRQKFFETECFHSSKNTFPCHDLIEEIKVGGGVSFRLRKHWMVAIILFPVPLSVLINVRDPSLSSMAFGKKSPVIRCFWVLSTKNSSTESVDAGMHEKAVRF